MSDPTPLSAEAARAMTLLVMASRVDSNLRSAVADVETYVAELQREIEGYQQALEQEMCERHRLGFVRSKDCFSPAAGSDARCMRVRRVLAGKEAQGGVS